MLGGVVVAVTVAGCDLDASPGEQSGTRSPGSDRRDPQPTPAEDPDAQLVRRVVDDLTAALALVGGVGRARRPLAAEVAPWRRLHAAHLEALDAADRTRPLRARGPATVLRNRVRREETALRRRLAAASVEAESGPLAALLATMSAAVAQQLAADAAGRAG